MARFQKLQVWHLANEILAETHRVMESLRGESALRDQMKRSAISIASNIAEGCERKSDAEFSHFLGISRGSASELAAQFHMLRSCGLLPKVDFTAILDKLDHCIRMLTKFIQRLAG